MKEREKVQSCGVSKVVDMAEGERKRKVQSCNVSKVVDMAKGEGEQKKKNDMNNWLHFHICLLTRD